MKKELISTDNLDSFISKEDGKLYVGSGRILTPGAKDELARRHVSVIYGEPPLPALAQQEGCRCGCGSTTFYVGPEQGELKPRSLEQPARTVAAMLSKEYGVSDPEQLRELTVEALKTIKNNI
ncbi:MAG: hypothetical protein J6I40_00245 [Mailhella sp.]|nr:hypothetical protein [Mailhella sp.]